MIPAWLHYTSIFFLFLGGLCAAIIVVDEWRHPQRMWIMNLVWPLTALFGTWDAVKADTLSLTA
jgi:hypothetical protein